MASPTPLAISRSDVLTMETPAPVSITDVELLSSYNWLDAHSNTPTIMVPGCPALWSATLGGTRQLKKDSGLVYISQNAARHPESPLEPLFRALYATNPTYEIRATDVVTDRNNIRKLLSFVNPSTTKDGLEAFTMNIEMINNTALFSRAEEKTVEFIGSQDFRGYGHEFEKAYTTSQINDSTGHHRIISYRFGGLKFIVRHETDGYCDDKSSAPSSNFKSHEDDALSNMLESLALSPSDEPPDTVPNAASKLKVRRGGRTVPLESTLEIKTRVSHKPLEIEDVAAQLWVSQTPKLVRAYHQKGLFQTPEVETVTEAIKSWEDQRQNDLRRLAGLVQKVIFLTKACGGRTVLKCDPIRDRLVLSKVERKRMLPDDLYSQWGDICGREPVSSGGEEEDSRLSARETTQRASKTIIQVGDRDYSIDVSKLPYFASYVRMRKPRENGHKHEPIELFDIALKGVESGFRQCFRSLPIDLSEYRTLFKTYELLQVDIMGGLSIGEVIANLKVGKADYDPDERRHIPGNKDLARDTAFQLLYIILFIQLRDEAKDTAKIYNAVMFVVSHSATFKHRTRRIIRMSFDERFNVTYKQRTKLNEWENKGAADETDVTTDENVGFDYFDSDDSL